MFFYFPSPLECRQGDVFIKVCCESNKKWMPSFAAWGETGSISSDEEKKSEGEEEEGQESIHRKEHFSSYRKKKEDILSLVTNCFYKGKFKALMKVRRSTKISRSCGNLLWVDVIGQKWMFCAEITRVWASTNPAQGWSGRVWGQVNCTRMYNPSKTCASFFRAQKSDQVNLTTESQSLQYFYSWPSIDASIPSHWCSINLTTSVNLDI